MEEKEINDIKSLVEKIIKSLNTNANIYFEDKYFSNNINSLEEKSISYKKFDKNNFDISTSVDKLISISENYISFIKILDNYTFNIKINNLYSDINDIFIKNNDKYSFINFLLDKFFKDYSSFKNNFSITRFLSSLLDNFISKKILELSGITTKYHNNNFFDLLNEISILNYEKIQAKGKIIISNNSLISHNFKFDMKLSTAIDINDIDQSENDFRLIRKLLEISDDNLYLVTDGNSFHGFGIPNDNTDSCFFVIEFVSRSYYKVKLRSKSNEYYLFSSKFGKAEIKDVSYNTDKFESTLKSTFNTKVIEKIDIDRIKSILDRSIKQKKGTVLIFTTDSIAKDETENLKNSLISVSDLNIDLVENFTRIDGAIIFDIKSNCYAIGAILDGLATDKGDPKRGSRYNSTVRYINKVALKNNVVAVVISEDETVDILPDIEDLTYTDNDDGNLNPNLNENNNSSKKSDKLSFYFLNKAIKSAETNNHIDASNFFYKALIYSTDNIRISKIYYNWGLSYYYQKDYENAIKNYSKAIEYNENYYNAVLNLALVYLDINDYNNAIKYFNDSINLDPKNEKSYINLAITYLKMRKYDEAIEYYNKSIELNPNNSDLYNNLGFIYFEKKDYQNAIKNYKISIDLDESNVNSLIGLGASLYNIGNDDESSNAYKKALEIDPYDPYIYNNIGNYFLREKNYEKALANYNKAIEFSNDKIESILYKNKAKALVNLKDYDEAIKNFDKVLELNSNDCEIYDLKAYIYKELKEYEKAIKLEEYALEKEPNNSYYNANLGAIYADKEEYEKAIQLYETAILLDDKNYIAIENLSRIYFYLNNYDKSIYYFEKIISLGKQDVNTFISLSNIYLKKKDFNKSIEYLLKSIEFNDSDVNKAIYLNLKELYILAEKFKESLQISKNEMSNEYEFISIFFDIISKVMLGNDYNSELELLNKESFIYHDNFSFDDIKDFINNQSDEKKNILLPILDKFKQKEVE